MLPVVLSPAYVRAALVGVGPLAVKRLSLLRDGGFAPAVYAPQDDVDIAQAAGNALIKRNPTAEELAGLNVLFVAGLAAETARALAEQARAANVLVNVEDDVSYCDFHTPGIVRRGDLVFSISTGGRGPGLARLLRQKLESLFPVVWAERMQELAALRDRLRGQGADAATVNAAVKRTVEDNGWLP